MTKEYPVENNNKSGLRRLKLPAKFVVVSWRDLAVIGLPVLVFVILVVLVAFKFARPAPLDNILIISGPDGSSYRHTAEK